MAAAVVPINPGKLLKQLDELWVSLGKEQDAGAEHPAAVLRACAMTLIVATEGPSDEVGETLAQLVRYHPSRLIVIRLGEGSEETLDAKVLAQCWMPFGRRQQICCEQIEINATAASVAEAAPVVRSLMVPDLPVAIWSRSRILLAMPEFAPVVELAHKLILDSAKIADLDGQIREIQAVRKGRRVADLAWTRLTRWRESIAQVFDDPGALAHLSSIDRARIGYQGAYLPLSALYLAAWLEHSLGRKLEFRFEHVDGGDRTRVQCVAFTGGESSFSITVGADRAVELHSAVRDAHTVFPVLSDYELLREELSLLGPDPVYDAVIESAGELARKYKA